MPGAHRDPLGANLQDARAPQRGVELAQRNAEQPSGSHDQRVAADQLLFGPLGGRFGAGTAIGVGAGTALSRRAGVAATTSSYSTAVMVAS